MSETQPTTPAAEQATETPLLDPDATDSAATQKRWNGRVAFYAVVGTIMAIYTAMAFLGQEWTTHGGERMGPGFFPRIIGVGSVALSLAGLVSALRRAAAPTEGGNDQSGGKHPALLAVIGLGLAVFVAIFVPVGAPLTAIAFLLLVYFLIERRRMARRAVLSVAFPLFLYLLFELWLQAGLPGGITSFL